MNILSDGLIEFLEYVEHSDDETAEKTTGTLVKNIHKKVIEVKSNPNMEVEFMTLLERDREKLEEGDLNRAKIGIRNMLKKNMDKNTIADLLEVDISLVEEVAQEIQKNN